LYYADVSHAAESVAKPKSASGGLKRRRTSEDKCIVSHAAANVPKPKSATSVGLKRRWTSEEREMLLKAFGSEITKKVMPQGKKIAELAKRMGTRTVAQVRTQVNNYVTRKIRFD